MSNTGIHLTQVTPTSSVSERGGLPSNARGVRGPLRHRRSLSGLSREAALADGVYLSTLRAHPRLARAHGVVAVRELRSPNFGHGGHHLRRHAPPLTTWFRAMWYMTSQKTGTSALSLPQVLGLRSYQTAWAWLHTLRRAMVRPGRDRLAGQVEVDETLVSGLGGARGRSTATKALVVVAAEEVGRGIGRIRMARIPDGSAETLEAFVAEAIEPGSGVHTDGWHGYTHLEANGYHHRVTPLAGRPPWPPSCSRGSTGWSRCSSAGCLGPITVG